MLSFGDPARVARILTEAGFGTPRFTRLDLTVDLGGGRGLDDATEQVLSMRPASQILLDQPASVRTAVAASVRSALAPYVIGNTVGLPGAVWLVDAPQGG